MDDQRQTRVPARSDAAGGTSGQLVRLPNTRHAHAPRGPLMEISFRRSASEPDSPMRQAAGFAGGLALAAVLGLILYLMLLP